MGLSDWLLKWQMKVSFDKCKMMHMGKNTANFTYKIWPIATQESDLRVIIKGIRCSRERDNEQSENITMLSYKSQCALTLYRLLWYSHLKTYLAE